MGAWGINNFENDNALDWLGDFIDNPSEEALQKAFASVNEVGNNYLESSESSEALGAAEIIAALKDNPSFDLPEDARETIKSLSFSSSDHLVANAIKAVETVKTNSELKELWEETENFSEWNKVIDNLISRLKT